MIHWRSIKELGYPTNTNEKYLVTDGKDISTSGIYGSTFFKKGEKPKFTFKGWDGDDNTYEDNSCCAGTPMFEMVPTHWCLTNELNLPLN